MKGIRVRDWSEGALRTASYTTVSLLVFFLILDGVDYLIWGNRFDTNVYKYMPFLWGGIYFQEAVKSVHERLNEIEAAVRSNSGK